MFLSLATLIVLLMGCLSRFGVRSGGCCADCVLFADAFDRADSSDLGSDWSEAAGDWEIDSGSLTVASSGAIAVHATTLGASHYRVQVALRSDTAGDVLGAVAYYTDTNNYYSAEVTLHDTGPVIALYKTVSGTRTLLRSKSLLPGEADTGEPITLTFCLEQAGAAGKLLSAELSTTEARTRISASDDALSGPGQAGLFAQTVAGTIAFDDFLVEATEDAVSACADCPKECYACRHGLPDQFQVVASGFVDEPFTCSGNVCPDLNATYTLDFDGLNASGWCQWSLEFPTVSCPYGSYNRISLEVLGTFGLRVSMGDTANPARSTWQDSVSNVHELFADDFDRSDSTNLGSDWTEVAGDWSIASNKLTVSDDDALAVHSAALGADDYQVSLVIRSDTQGDQLGAVFCYAGANNYYEALVTIHNSAPVIALYKTVGGTRTLLVSRNLTAGDANTDAEIGLFVSLQVGQGGSALVADLGSATNRIAVFDGDVGSGGTAGVVARSAAGTVSVNDFVAVAYDCTRLTGRAPSVVIDGPCNYSGGAAVAVNAL